MYSKHVVSRSIPLLEYTVDWGKIHVHNTVPYVLYCLHLYLSVLGLSDAQRCSLRIMVVATVQLYACILCYELRWNCIKIDQHLIDKIEDLCDFSIMPESIYK